MSLARRSLQVVALICTLIVGAASMAVIVSQTTWFKEWLRAFIVRQADDYLNGRLSIGRLDGNLFFGVEMEDVDITMNGKLVISLQDVGLDYNALTFLRGHVVLDSIRLNRPTLHLQKIDGTWNLASLVKAQTPDEPRNRRPLEIGEIGISDGTLYVEEGSVSTSGVTVPKVVDRIDASIGLSSDANELKVAIGHASLRTSSPQFGINDLSGVIRRHGDGVSVENLSIRTEQTSLRLGGSVSEIGSGNPLIDVKASSDKFAVNELAKLVPGLQGYELQPAFELNATGPSDRLEVQLNAREKEVGQIIGQLTIDAQGPERRVAGSLQTLHFNVGPVARNAAVTTDITGQGNVDVTLPSGREPLRGTYTLHASRAVVAGYDVRNLAAKGRIDGNSIRLDANGAADGGRATTAGTIALGTPLRLDLTGRAEDVDLRNLPAQLGAPRVPSRLQFAYTLTGRGRAFSGTVAMAESTLADATLATGTSGTFSIGNGAPAYTANGQVANLDLQKIGQAFGIDSLAASKFQSRINAQAFEVRGNGGGRYPLALEASGSLTDSEMFGASLPRFEFTANLADGDAHVTGKGEVNGLDPTAIVNNDRVAGRIDGRVDVKLTFRNYSAGVTAESLDAAGRITIGRSTIGGVDIDAAVVDGSYANKAGVLNQFVVEGPDVNVNASGPIALNETDTSNLTLHAESPALAQLADVVGRPGIKGSVAVDATVTGNGTELKAHGTLNGGNIGQGENSALDLDSTFDVTVPRLTLADATVEAKTGATFLQLAGQKINELTADTTYSRQKLDFNAQAKQGVRQLMAGGSVLLHPDHQEVHISNLALRAEKIEWRTAPNAEATMQYGKDRVAIENLQLVNADQRIVAEGTIGATDEALQVRAENVDVAQIDALLLGDQRVSGRLNANAKVTGTRSAPLVAGDFTLAQGAFRDFKFESFAGTVDYAASGLTMDVRLNQNPQAWLTAKGFAPISLFRPNPPEMGHEHFEAASGDAINLDVASSEIDLGLIQGFTSYVTNVSGTIQANFTITGSGYDPHLDGAIDVKGGALTTPDLGMSYTGLDTHIDLKPDEVTISQFRILDDDKNWLTIGGSLAVHERGVGAVDIKVQSDDFKVINNKTADLKFDSDFHVTGTVRAPKVEGTVEVEPGTLDVAELLASLTENPYSTTATEISPAESAGPEPTLPPTPGVFDSMDLNLSVVVPGDLLLRGNNIRPANAPIDVGNMNAYVGGTVDIVKAPGDKMRITGQVNTVRGTYTFQGRQFAILRDGRIQFFGNDVIDPLIDLQASRVIAGVETVVHVRGTMRQPELSFTSSPPLEEADILSLIVFNMPINELGQGQQVAVAVRAQQLAGGYVASGLSESIGKALNLDEFEIQAAGDQGLAPTVTIGQQVSKGLFVRLRQGFGNEQATEFILEYQLANYLRLQGTASDISSGAQRSAFRRVERGGLDLIFFFSY